MKDEELKFEEVKAPLTLGGSSYILSLYIYSVKEAVRHLDVELYKPRRYISLTVISDRDLVWLGSPKDLCVCVNE
jgi:hypothetical protein